MPQLDWLDQWVHWSPLVRTMISLALSLATSFHIVLTKRHTSSAIGWLGLVWFAPLVGTLLYVLFGINRITRRARLSRRITTRAGLQHACDDEMQRLRHVLREAHAHLLPIARLVAVVTGEPLTFRNHVEPLIDGDETYQAMLDAIENAQCSVTLSTYIFYDDPVGLRMLDALSRARQRGVEVRILIDGVGSRYRFRSIVGRLKAAGLTVATFLPTLVPAWLPFVNLRNHRKILVADGCLALTGGMNIDKAFLHHDPSDEPRRKTLGRLHDLHFQVRGPVVAELQRVFVEDWAFTTGEFLQGDLWLPAMEECGSAPVRCVADGPDQKGDRLLTTILGAIASARVSIRIQTPYFLPDEPLISALEVASLRGVHVDVLVPAKSNLRLVDWAITPFLARVLAGGCRVWRLKPPFDHSKLMIVDDAWAFIGSANIDTRSLRLNFEVNLECYGGELVERLGPIFFAKLERAKPFTLDEALNRPWPIRLRDGVFRLLSPYL